MINAVLFPSDYFNKKIADEALSEEYCAAVSCGRFEEILIFSYEDWFVNGRLILSKVPTEERTAVYRGWMMKPQQYRNFYRALKEKGVRLITTPEEYGRFHIYPNIYPALKGDSPGLLIYPQGTKVDLGEVKGRFRRFMVKDYVKSVKGTEFPAFFESDVEEQDFEEWMKVFYRYRAELFTGGICIKEYVELKRYDGKTNEHRVFYINNTPAAVCRNSSQAEYCPPPPRALVEKYSRLESPFYTVDYAELEDGSWKALEAGDGGVSGLTDVQDAESFYRALWACFL